MVCISSTCLYVSQTVDMPVFFYIDSEMAGDWNCRNIQDVTLSYKFHKVSTCILELEEGLQSCTWQGTCLVYPSLYMHCHMPLSCYCPSLLPAPQGL